MKDFIIKLLVPYGFFKNRTRDPYILVFHAQNHLIEYYKSLGLYSFRNAYLPEQNEALVILTKAQRGIAVISKTMIW